MGRSVDDRDPAAPSPIALPLRRVGTARIAVDRAGRRLPARCAGSTVGVDDIPSQTRAALGQPSNRSGAQPNLDGMTHDELGVLMTQVNAATPVSA